MDGGLEVFPRSTLPPPRHPPRREIHLQAIVEETNSRPAMATTGKDVHPVDPDDSDSGSEHTAKRQKRTYSCEQCGTTYTEKRTLARHRHTDLHRQRMGLPPVKKHACAVCGKLFTRGHDRQRHENEKHRGVRRFASMEPVVPESTNERAADDSSDAPSCQNSHTSSPPGPEVFPSIHEEPWASPPTATPPSLHSGNESQLLSARSPSDASTSDERHWWTRTASIPSPIQIKATLTSAPGPAQSGSINHHGLQYDSITAGHDIAMIDASQSDTATEDSPAMMDLSSGEPSLRGRSVETDASSVMNLPVNCLTGGLGLRSPRLNSISAVTSSPRAPHPTICIVCSMPFEEDLAELIPHLRGHLEHFTGEHRCLECQVSFVHKEDLLRHRNSAAKGHCGFTFAHNLPCRGHHPPVLQQDASSLSDCDSFRLCNQLRHWEQSQLRAYMDEVRDLVSARQVKKRDCDSYSIEALLNPSRESFESYAVSINTFASAPCDVAADGKTDVGGLQKRLRLMSLGAPKSHTRHLINKRLAVSRPAPTSNKTMTTAILDSDIDRVRELLEDGIEPASITNDQPELLSAALWGRAQASKVFAAHSLQEQLWGHCPTCNVDTTSLKRDSYLVKCLLKHDASANHSGGLCGSPLITAAFLGRADIMLLLLHHGARLDIAGPGVFASPLCAAVAQAGHAKNWNVVKLLLEKGARVLTRGTEGSALDMAKKRKEFWAAKALEMTIPLDDASQHLTCCAKTIKVLERMEAGGDLTRPPS